MPLGDDLLCYAGNARDRVRLVSPFIKADVLARVLEVIPAEVTVDVCTRWRADEIAAGVSDLEVWDVCEQSGNATLCLCDRLHAKAFVFDEIALVGSANLTAAALGWRARSNLELLHGVPATSDSVVSLLAAVDLEAVPATQALRDMMRDLVEAFPVRFPIEVAAEERTPWTVGETWFPSLRSPELLFQAYVGSQDDLTTAASEQAARDLQVLDLPPDLSEEQFPRFVGLTLLQRAPFSRLDSFLETPRVFGEVVRWLRGLEGGSMTHQEGQQAWQTTMRWLLYFLPNRYERKVFRHSEVVGRAGCFLDE